MTVRTSLVSISDGDQLNQGYYNDIYTNLRHLRTGTALYTSANTTSTSFQDYLTLTTPTSLKASQTVLIEGWATCWKDAADSASLRLLDSTGSAVIVAVTTWVNGDRFMIPIHGTVTISSSGSAKDIKLQFARTAGTTNPVYVDNAYLKATLVES